jgi:hypothetical protein
MSTMISEVYDNRFSTIETRLAVLQWITGATFALVAGLFLKAFLP